MSVAKTIDVSGGVLVGHDGSANAGKAVEKAVELAGALGLTLTVVRAWTIQSAPRPDNWERGYVPPLEDFAAAALEALDQDVAPIAQAHPDCEMRTTVVRGPASNRLIEVSHLVAMIVVGRRGAGGFAGLHLGSVSDQVVSHAKCTVVVVNVE